MAKIKDIPFQERPREKALLYGVESLSNAELLAIILQVGTKDKSALELSYDLLSKLNGINGLMYASIDELKKIKGISDAKAILIKAITTLNTRMELDDCLLNDSNTNKIASYFRKLLKDSNQESTYIVIVDSKNEIKNIKELFVGTKTSINMSPNIIFKYVLDHGKRFYLIHNHPSGGVEPSMDDNITTSRLELLAMDKGLEFIDHYIIGRQNYYSFEYGKVMYY